MEASFYLGMPHDHNGGFFPVTGKPVVMGIDDVIEYSQDTFYSENRLRARHFLGYPIPAQPGYIAHMVQATQAQRERRLHEGKRDDKRPTVTRKRWYNGLRADRRKRAS